MKYQTDDFIQIPRYIFRDINFLNLSAGAKGMYLILKELEHQYTNEDNSIFFKSDAAISKMLNVSDKTVRKYKKELVNAGLIVKIVSKIPNIDGSKSEQSITCYRIIYWYPLLKSKRKILPYAKENITACHGKYYRVINNKKIIIKNKSG